MKKHLLFLTALIALSGTLFAEETLLDLLGAKRVDASGEPVMNQKITAVYFSAHWCGPCKVFTPKLVEVYNQAKKEGLDFEVIFVSSDRSEEDMLDYMKEAEMPWSALPYDSKGSAQAKEFKSETLESRGIPYLVILNSAGEVIAKNGRREIEQLGLQALRKWGSQKPASLSRNKKSTSKKAEAPKELPAPEKDDMTIGELNTQLVSLNGKIIETKINSVSSFEQINDRQYRAYCYYYTGNSSLSGESVLIPKEGKELFEKMAKRGFRGSTETVYLLVHSKKPIRVKGAAYSYSYQLEAVGERYRKSKNEYSW